MNPKENKEKNSQLTNGLTKDPAIRRFSECPHVNHNFYAEYRCWLKESRYSTPTINIYSVAARQVISFLDKPYWTFDPDEDINQVLSYFQNRPIANSTLKDYQKGVKKFQEYLYLRLRKPVPAKQINWSYFINSFSKTLQEDIRAYLLHRQHNWKPEIRFERSCDVLSQLTYSLRWLHQFAGMVEFSELTPQMWYHYLDHRVTSGIKPSTVNGELSALKSFALFLQEEDRPICERLLLVDPIQSGDHLPKDLPINQLKRLQEAIQSEIHSSHTGKMRTGRMDLAWFLLMVHSGLRSSEVRFLKLNELDCANHKLFIRQSKGLKDRIVYLSKTAVNAIQSYLEVRGPAEALPEYVFIYRHKPISEFYFGQRLHTYQKRCGVIAKPHQLRHSCATLLLNAGAPVLTVQALLGHKWVDTTLGYARLYDGTVAADYYQAMSLIENRLSLPEDRLSLPPSIGKLIALTDSLRDSTLNPSQAETVRQLRTGLRALLDRQNQIMEDVKVL